MTGSETRIRKKWDVKKNANETQSDKQSHFNFDLEMEAGTGGQEGSRALAKGHVRAGSDSKALLGMDALSVGMSEENEGWMAASTRSPLNTKHGLGGDDVSEDKEVNVKA